MAAETNLTLSHYRQLAARYGYRYQNLHGPKDPLADETVMARGAMQEHGVAPGIGLVVSDVMNLSEYRADSCMQSGFLSILMLDGEVEARFAGKQHLNLTSRTAFSACYGDGGGMSGQHSAGIRLRSIAIMVDACSLRDDVSGEAVDATLRRHREALQHWRPSAGLLAGAGRLLAPESLREGNGHALAGLQRQGFAMQMLAEALGAFDPAVMTSQRRPRGDTRVGEQRRLDRVRQLLHDCPREDHHLDELARLACMSSSALRQKFRATYGCTVFDYLRERRLQVAADGIRQEGWNVDQAAHFSGYLHASNFASAFKRRFGVNPSRW